MKTMLIIVVLSGLPLHVDPWFTPHGVIASARCSAMRAAPGDDGAGEASRIRRTLFSLLARLVATPYCSERSAD